MADDIKRVVVRLSAEGGASAGQQVEQFSQRAERSLSKTVAAMGASAAAADRLDLSMLSLARGGMAAAGLTLGAGSAIAFARSLTETTARAERLSAVLRVTHGANAAQELSWVRAEADRLGLGLTDTATAYASMAAASRGTSLEGEGIRRVFGAVSAAASTMGMSSEQTSGALRALEQMISKGKVSAEELRGQLGERMPGAFQIAARAMGVTTSELDAMLQKGEVLSVDFLPRFADQLRSELGDAATDAADRMDAATSRMGNAWDRLLERISKAGPGEFIKGAVGGFTNDMNAVSDAMELTAKRGGGNLEQWNNGISVLLGRMLNLQRVSAEFLTVDQRLDSATQRLRELNNERDRMSGNGQSPGLYMRSEIASAERDLAQATADYQTMLSNGDTGGGDFTASRMAAALAREQELADAAAAAAAEEAAKRNKTASEKAARDAIAAARKEADYRAMLTETLAGRAPRAIDIDNGNGGNTVLGLAAAEKRSQAIADATYKANQQREQQAQEFARSLLDEAEQLNVDLIESDTERAQAQLDIEVRRMRERMELLRVDGDERIKMEESIARIIAARKQAIEIQAARAARTELDKTVEGATKDVFTKLSMGETIKGSDILKQLSAAMAQDSWKNSIRPLLTGDKPGAEGGDFFAKMLDKLGGSADKTATGFDSIVAKMSGFENGLGGIAQALWQMVAGSGGGSGGGLGGLFGSLAGLFGESSSTVAQPLTDMGSSTVGMSLAKGGAFTNKVFNHTTPFAFRRGDSFSMGIMGEAGDEAVMPLARDGAGRLGVRAQGGGGARQVSYVTNLTQVFAPGVTQADMAMHGQALANQMRAETINSAVRPGGALWRAARGY